MTTVTKKQTSLAKILETRESRMGALIFLVMLYFHVGSLYVFKVGFTWTAFTIFLISYFVKITGITMGYHRLFAHRTFKAKRWFQFYLALAGSTAIQGGVLWWASHHRGHHQHSDLDEDLHSPITHSPLHAHLGWMWSKDCFKPTKHKMLDFARFPEIRFINRHYLVLILLQGLFFYGMGLALETWFPELETTGSQIFVWDFYYQQYGLGTSLFLSIQFAITLEAKDMNLMMNQETTGLCLFWPLEKAGIITIINMAGRPEMAFSGGNGAQLGTCSKSLKKSDSSGI